MKILSSDGYSLWFPWIEIISLSSSSQSSDSNFVFPWNASLLMNTYLWGLLNAEQILPEQEERCWEHCPFLWRTLKSFSRVGNECVVVTAPETFMTALHISSLSLRRGCTSYISVILFLNIKYWLWGDSQSQDCIHIYVFFWLIWKQLTHQGPIVWKHQIKALYRLKIIILREQHYNCSFI